MYEGMLQQTVFYKLTEKNLAIAKLIPLKRRLDGLKKLIAG
jgi:hypothetical protein